MKERPILFSAPMVRAILDGRKSQTRRALKFQAFGGFTPISPSTIWHGEEPRRKESCPYGQPGDRLWVRETWRLSPDACEGWPMDATPCSGFIDYRADGSSLERHAPDFAAIERLTIGRDPEWDWDSPPHSWRSPIHMPRWASRITLEITGIRVERLQDISADNAIAEGIDQIAGPTSCNSWRNYLIGKAGEMNMHCSSPSRSYQTLWDAINARRGHPWESNPWVWVIEFRRIV